VSEEIREIIIMEGIQTSWSPGRRRWLTGFASR